MKKWLRIPSMVLAATLRPSPTLHIVGFPKTGNTWFRFLLGRYVQLLAGTDDFPLCEDCDFDRAAFAKAGASLAVATHAPLTWETQTAADLTEQMTVAPFRATKVVLLVRHPLDACLSHMMQKLYRGRRKHFDGLAEFCADPVFGLEKFIRFYELWAPHLSAANVHLVRYEDMKAEPTEIASGALRFLGLPIQPAQIEASVSFASFSNMRQLEARDPPVSYRTSGFPVFGKRDPDNEDSRHVRRGNVGGYTTHLAPCELNALLDQIGSRLEPYGYLMHRQANAVDRNVLPVESLDPRSE